MTWLNYHHLFYFWTIVREGGMTRAASLLRLAQPTLSAQIRQLEDRLGVRLFERQGRGLVPTDVGRVVFRYADEIFTLGQELQEALRGHVPDRPLVFVVGVVSGLPKFLTQRLLQAVLMLPESVRLQVHEGSLETLLDRLLRYDLDLVLSDGALKGMGKGRVHSHLLGACDVGLFGAESLVARFSEPFPKVLHGAPLLLPSEGSVLRADVERWLHERGLRPVLRGSFEDADLLGAFGEAGQGLFPAPILGEIPAGWVCLGPLEGLKLRVHALSTERRLRHPAVLAIQASARQCLGA